MNLTDLHIHTTFSDGKDTPEEMVHAAIRKGMVRIGFSDHSHTAFDERYCMSRLGTEQYRTVIRALRERYQSEIDILCGVEQDYYSDVPADDFDYVIGSVHYVKAGNVYIPVDESPKILLEGVQKYFRGDIYRLIEEYFCTVAQVVDKTGADIIGHFDLISKFNEGSVLFDEKNSRYIAAWTAAADRLLTTGKPFEINTGAISRGYRTGPYPSTDILSYIRSHGGSFVLSSDSHRAGSLCFGFEALQELIERPTLK